ncbi:MAG: hypothetical protein K0R60_1746, partial [Microbacterium sp.]|nr:hypothetical protein [Microbacterium sp.]
MPTHTPAATLSTSAVSDPVAGFEYEVADLSLAEAGR